MKKTYLLLLCLSVIGLITCSSDDCVDEPEQYSASENLAPDENGWIELPYGVYVQKAGDDYVWSGDIILSQEQIDKLTAPQTRGFMLLEKHWPGGIVYYEWGDIDQREKQALQEAMEIWERNCPVLRFVHVASGDQLVANKIIMQTGRNGVASSSSFGMIGGRQLLKISENQNNITHAAIHEIGHALGLYHEHQRPDRDKYITIRLPGDINPGQYTPYENLNAYLSKEFDYNSVMMYKDHIYRKDGRAVNPTDTLTRLDIETVNKLYAPQHDVEYSVAAKCECPLSGTVSGLKSSYKGGDRCEISVTPREGLSFDGWYINGGKQKLPAVAGQFGFYVTCDTLLVAKFKSKNGYYHLQTSVSMSAVRQPNGFTMFQPDGTVTVDGIETSQIALSEKGTHTLVAKSNTTGGIATRVFSHWQDLDTGEKLATSSTYTFSIKRDMRVRAVFKSFW